MAELNGSCKHDRKQYGEHLCVLFCGGSAVQEIFFYISSGGFFVW